jgi:hypothetical protein
VHEALIKRTHEDRLVGHISRDATAIEAFGLPRARTPGGARQSGVPGDRVGAFGVGSGRGREFTGNKQRQKQVARIMSDDGIFIQGDEARLTQFFGLTANRIPPAGWPGMILWTRDSGGSDGRLVRLFSTATLARAARSLR